MSVTRRSSTMDDLITIVPAAEVPDDFKEAAKAWDKWSSTTYPETFPFSYSEDEEVLIIKGSATLTPKGKGGTVVTIGAGDKVIFHKGFKCQWVVTEEMEKYYHYPVEPAKIRCDNCGVDCWEESFFVAKTEQDICPKCKKIARGEDRRNWKDAERQKHGEPYESEDEAPKKRKPAAKKPAAKKPAAKKQKK